MGRAQYLSCQEQRPPGESCLAARETALPARHPSAGWGDGAAGGGLRGIASGTFWHHVVQGES